MNCYFGIDPGLEVYHGILDPDEYYWPLWEEEEPEEEPGMVPEWRHRRRGMKIKRK